MKKSRYSEEQIIGILKQSEAQRLKAMEDENLRLNPPPLRLRQLVPRRCHARSAANQPDRGK